SRKLLRLLIRRRILRDWRLLQLGYESRRCNQLEDPLLRRGEQEVEILDLRIKTEILELRPNPLGIFFVLWGTNVMRTCAQALHIVAHIRRIGNGAKLLFPTPLGLRGGG